MLRMMDFYRENKANSGCISHHIEEINICPRCGAGILPVVLSSRIFSISNDGASNCGVAVYLCKLCRRSFYAEYDFSLNGIESTNPITIAPITPPRRDFGQMVTDVSPKFVETYYQAAAAETYELSEIAGMAYRRALEFLVKDYLIHTITDQREDIERKPLGQCINLIDNKKLKACASRATWLGNDFTHYQRRFDEFEIDDLKGFIEATLHWISMELITEKALATDPRK